MCVCVSLLYKVGLSSGGSTVEQQELMRCVRSVLWRVCMCESNRRYKVYESVGRLHYSCSPGPASVFQATFIMARVCVSETERDREDGRV